jgi:hypothetical protein
MAVVQQPTKGLSEGIGGVNSSPYVAQDHFTFGHPFLQGKMLDVNVAAPISGALGVGHHDGSRIIFIDFSSLQLLEGKIYKDG